MIPSNWFWNGQAVLMSASFLDGFIIPIISFPCKKVCFCAAAGGYAFFSLLRVSQSMLLVLSVCFNAVSLAQLIMPGLHRNTIHA